LTLLPFSLLTSLTSVVLSSQRQGELFLSSLRLSSGRAGFPLSCRIRPPVCHVERFFLNFSPDLVSRRPPTSQTVKFGGPSILLCAPTFVFPQPLLRTVLTPKFSFILLVFFEGENRDGLIPICEINNPSSFPPIASVPSSNPIPFSHLPIHCPPYLPSPLRTMDLGAFVQVASHHCCFLARPPPLSKETPSSSQPVRLVIPSFVLLSYLNALPLSPEQRMTVPKFSP